MLESLVNALNGMPKEAVTVIIASLPVAELRGAIPMGMVVYEMPLVKTFALSYLGNMLPVIPLLLFLQPVSERLRRFHLWSRFFDWLFERARKKANIVERYEAIGLMLFVAIPLPVTGAWTGCIAASIFKLRFRYALLAIMAGVFIAGIIVSTLTTFGILLVNMPKG